MRAIRARDLPGIARTVKAGVVINIDKLGRVTRTEHYAVVPPSEADNRP